jgi:chromate reductase
LSNFPSSPIGSEKSVFKILGISGSGRKESYNSALLRASKELLPQSAQLETYDVSEFPLFNEDLENEMPASVKEFRKKILAADTILFAATEYNYSISAVMKNAIEWGNRPDNSWDGKPAAIMSASASPRGGARAQLHLRQILVDLNMYPINRPQLLFANAEEKFDRSPHLADERSRQLLRELLFALVAWTRKLHGG